MKTEHAERVYKNYYKGDPPFKPQKGNFGHLSWFAGTGNPYVGGQTQSYTVTVDVTVPDIITKLDANFFNTFMTNYAIDNNVDLRDTNTHRAFWQALGQELERYDIVEVTVPQCLVSQQGGGTFIAASARGRLRVTLANPVKLKNDLGALGVNVNLIEQAVDNKNNTNAPSFTLEFASVKPEALTNVNNPRQFMAKLLSSVPVLGVIPPPILTWTIVAAPIPPVPPGLENHNALMLNEYQTRKKVTVTLTYADFKVARQQAKYWAIASSNGTIIGIYGGMTIVQGANWSDKSIRAYTASY